MTAIRLGLSAVVALLIFAPTLAQAQSTTQSSEFLRTIANAPELSAAAQRAAAAKERVAAAGRLPDPEIEGMQSRMNGPMGEAADMWEVSLMQPLPKRGERAADRQRSEAAYSMARAEYALMAGELAAETAMALAEASGAERRIQLLKTQLERLAAVLRALEVKLAAGSQGRMADRLTVQTRAASMQLMIEEESRMAADALTGARGRLGLAEDAPLPAFAAPTREEISIETSAPLLVAAARGDEADAMIKMAQASARPMTSVGVRFERERTSMGNEDTVGVAFSSEIPFRSHRYARAEVRAAEAERAAAKTEANAVKFRISSTLTRVDRAQQFAESARRLSGETLERLNAEYDAMIRSASVGGMGQSTVLETVELLEKATEAELQMIRAETAAQAARAELWRYVPVTQFPLPNS